MGGALLAQAPESLWVSGSQLQFVKSGADATLKTQQKNEIFDLTLAPQVDPGEIFVQMHSKNPQNLWTLSAAVLTNLTYRRGVRGCSYSWGLDLTGCGLIQPSKPIEVAAQTECAT